MSFSVPIYSINISSQSKHHIVILVGVLRPASSTLGSTALSDHHGLAYLASRSSVLVDRAAELSVQLVTV